MPRIAGVDIPMEKRVHIALQSIYALGPHVLDAKALPQGGLPSSARSAANCHRGGDQAGFAGR